MPAYRIYRIGPNGRLIQGERLSCQEDAQALAQFKLLVAQVEPAELWDGGRLVARNPPTRA